MTDDQVFSSSQLQALAKVETDVLTFWLRRGLVLPNQAPDGKGKHHRFHRDEIMIAAFLRAARDAGLNVAALSALVAEVRRGVKLFGFVPPYGRWVGELIELVETGRDPFDEFVGRGIMTDEERCRVRAIAEKLSKDEARHLWIGDDVYRGAGRWMAWRDADGEWHLSIASPSIVDGVDGESGPPFYIVFNCDAIFPFRYGIEVK